MVRLAILLKNGKEVVTTEVPLLQAIEWRERLKGNPKERIYVITKNGRYAMEGCWVKSYLLKGKTFTTDEAASAMYLEPYSIYRCGEDHYQYSLLGKGFEKAKHSNGHTTWELSALPEGEWTRIGKDVL